MRRTLAIPVLVCLLLGTWVQMLMSAWLLSRWPAHNVNRPIGVNLTAEEIGDRAWPFDPPGTWAKEWPKVNTWTEWHRFGMRGVDARHVEGEQSVFSMEVLSSGWPLDTHYKQQVWWPYQDPAFAHTGPNDVPCGPIVSGMIGNSLIFSLAAWLVLFAGPYTVRSYIVAARRARRQCPKCGYPIGTSTVCSECGGPVTPRAR